MLQITGLAKRYTGADQDALSDIALDCPEGTFLTLLGASGCGKSTLLRCIAGLEDAQAGRIEIAGISVFDASGRVAVPANRRRIGMVFQSYAIWPHMTVGGNVGYPLKVNGVRGEEQRRRIAEALDLVGLSGFADRPATGLSGGQQQRVALARAVVCRPQLLLLDEPMSNLDAPLRRQLGEQLRELQQRLGLTVVYVTHDRDEALTMSDQIVVMRAGRIVDSGAPLELYENPTTQAGALSVGEANFLPSDVAEAKDLTCSLFDPPLRGMAARPSVFMVRPERVRLDGEPHHPSASAVVISAIFRGMVTEVTVRLEDGTVFLLRSTEPNLPKPGDRIRITVPQAHTRVVAASRSYSGSAPPATRPQFVPTRSAKALVQFKQQEVYS